MDVTREYISCILELREMLLSFQTGFSLVNAAVVCAILESIFGLEPSPLTTELRYSKLVIVSSFCPFTLSLYWCHWCCLSSPWSSQHWSSCCRRSTNFDRSSSPATPSMSSAKWRLMIALLQMLTVASRFSLYSLLPIAHWDCWIELLHYWALYTDCWIWAPALQTLLHFLPVWREPVFFQKLNNSRAQLIWFQGTHVKINWYPTCT